MPKVKPTKRSSSLPPKLTKPIPGKKIVNFDITNVNIPGLVKEVTKVSPINWTNAPALVNSLSNETLARNTAAQALGKHLKNLDLISNSSNVSNQLARYALNCLNYVSSTKFKENFNKLYIAKIGRVQDRILSQRSQQLRVQALNNASDITSSALDVVRDSTLERMNEEVNEDVDMVEEVDNYEGLMAPARDVNFCPNQPKLPIINMEKILKKCHVAITSVPKHLVPNFLIEELNLNTADQKTLKSLHEYSNVLKVLREIFDEDIEYEDIPKLLWSQNTSTWSRKEIDFFKIVKLVLTDFWGLCGRKDFGKGHERSFWVDYVNPLFKHLPIINQDITLSWCESMVESHSHSQLIPGVWTNTTEKLYADGIGRSNGFELIIMESSGPYAEEYMDHSLGDTWKLIKMSTNSLRSELLKYQEASIVTAKKLSVLSVQCIRDKITLMKTNLSDSSKWKFTELRSATIPVSWDTRESMLLVFELLSTVHNECVNQKEVLKQLRRQANSIVPVEENDTVRSHIQSSTLLNSDD